MTNPFLIDQFDAFDALVQHINQQPDWRRNMLAGQYAAEMALADHDNAEELADDYCRNADGDGLFACHLRMLAKQGCAFTPNIALEHAKGMANLPFDSSILDSDCWR